jgi:hypothetical protein
VRSELVEIGNEIHDLTLSFVNPLNYFFLFVVDCIGFFENRVILKWQKRHLDTSRHFGFKRTHKNFAILRKIQEKNAYLWTLNQKPFLAAVLNSGAILFFRA